MRRIGRLLDALDQVGPVEAVRRQAGLGVAGVLRRLRELDHVLGVGLGVVVGHEDGGVPDVVDRAVVEDVARRVAHVGARVDDGRVASRYADEPPRPVVPLREDQRRVLRLRRPRAGGIELLEESVQQWVGE